MPSRALLFDFDYTLADSSRGSVECINYALRGMGLAAVSHERACRTIGLSLPDTLARLAGESQRARGGEFARLFRERADQVMADLTVLLPAVPESLPVLQRAGLRLGIVSSKYRYRIEGLLAREGLADLFGAIVGGEDVSQPKPDPEGLLLGAARLGAPVEDCLYIGDSVTDAEAARRAGISFAAVLSGVTQRDEFAGYPVCAFLPDLAGLPVLLGLEESAADERDAGNSRIGAGDRRPANRLLPANLPRPPGRAHTAARAHQRWLGDRRLCFHPGRRHVAAGADPPRLPRG